MAAKGMKKVRLRVLLLLRGRHVAERETDAYSCHLVQIDGGACCAGEPPPRNKSVRAD